MKTIKVLLLFILISSDSFGQNIAWEILNVGYSFGLSKDENGSYWNDKINGIYGTFSLGSELRMKLLDNRLSPGLQIGFSGWNRYDQGGFSVEDSHQFAFSFMSLCDYNFTHVHSKFIPFAGIGVGLSRVRYDSRLSDSSGGWVSHFAYSPRIGVDYKRLRLALEYKYLGSRNNYFNIRLGFVIGS
jgi:opacity protein-like surface antigen